MNKYGFIYLWRDKKHNRYYVGSHWGTEDDGYICSSSWMKKAYKIRPEDFKRRIIKKIYTNKSDLLHEEYRYLNMIKSEEKKVKYYNINTTWKHWNSDPDIALSTKEKISKKTKEAMNSPEIREKYLEGMKKRIIPERSEEQRKEIGKKISETRLKKFKKRKEAGLPCYDEQTTASYIAAGKRRIGTTLSKEHKMKIGLKLKELWKTEEYRNKVVEKAAAARRPRKVPNGKK